MNANTVRRDDRDAARRPRRIRPMVTLVTGIAALSLLTAACGSDDKDGKGVAAANPSKAQNGSPGGPGGGGQGDPVAYSKCMRENGVPNFPDPDSNGGVAIEGNKVNMNSAAFKAAEQKCKQYNPPPPPEPAANKAAAVKYAKCMRENGVPKFPDPNAEGGTDLDGSTGIDPGSAVYKKADEICKKDLPNGGKKPQQNGG